MGEDTADEVVGRFRQAKPPRVLLIQEQVVIRGRVGQVVVDVPTAAGPVGKWLGHVGGDSAIVLSVLAAHHLKKGVAVGGCEGIGIDKVDFVLPVCILMVRLVGIPADLAHGLHHVS